MKKQKSLLWLYAVISFVVIVVAVVLSLTVGINLGTDIGGGTQIEVTVSSTENISSQVDKIEDVLKNYNLRSERVFVEDKYTDTLIVVRVAEKSIENEADIRTLIAEELGIDEANIAEFATINGTVTNRAVIWTSVAIICLLLVVFIAGWIRYGIIAGLTLMISLLHTLLLSVAMLIITRLPINFVSLIVILCGIVFVLFALVLTLERIKENSALKHNESLSTAELVEISKRGVIKPLIVFAVLIMVVAIVLVCIPVRYVALSALSLIVCLAVCVYSYYLLGIELHKYLLELKATNDKLKLSKNNSPAPAETAKKLAAKAKKEKVKKEKAKKEEDKKEENK